MNPTIEAVYKHASGINYWVNGSVWAVFMLGAALLIIVQKLNHKNHKKVIYLIGIIFIGFASATLIQAYQFNAQTHTTNFQNQYYQNLDAVVQKLSNTEKYHYNLEVVKKRIQYRLNKPQFQKLKNDINQQQKIITKNFDIWNKLDTIKIKTRNNVFNQNPKYLAIPKQLNQKYPIYWNVQYMNPTAKLFNSKYLYNDGLRKSIDNINKFKAQHYTDYKLQKKLTKQYLN